MLRSIQERLDALYDLALEIDVDDFLCDGDEAIALGGEEAKDRGEVLFVVDGPRDARVALYVTPDAQTQTAAGLLDAQTVQLASLAAEGVSHLVYLAFRSHHALPVSALELELQAEVDKWALGVLSPYVDLRAATLAGRGVGLVRMRDRSRRLRDMLYRRVSYLDSAESECGARYRAAAKGGAHYSEYLEQRFLDVGDIVGLTSELRRFYRMGASEKLTRARVGT